MFHEISQNWEYFMQPDVILYSATWKVADIESTKVDYVCTYVVRNVFIILQLNKNKNWSILRLIDNVKEITESESKKIL